MIENAILIAGPTASGKSALALDFARRENGVIVNADSMQVYSVLRVLTARPGPEELSATTHFLYGHVDPCTPYSTGAWLRDVEALLNKGHLSGRRVIFVGGTGLYFRALLGGLAAMPRIPVQLRERWRARLAKEGAEALHRLLRERDGTSAAWIRPEDGQRIVRALEVLEVSGRSILSLQAEAGTAVVDANSALKLVIEPERAWLRTRIDDRFDGMIAAGALDEAKALAALNLDSSRPAAKAIGVRELQAALSGETSLDEAVVRAKAASRQYAKRQMTWFRHQLGNGWKRVDPEQLAYRDWLDGKVVRK